MNMLGKRCYPLQSHSDFGPKNPVPSEQAMCNPVLDALVKAGFLCLKSVGTYVMHRHHA
jgi:hypothetical protein